MLLLALLLQTAPPMMVVDEKDVRTREPVPHGNIGMSTAWRITDAVPGRNFEFRRRALDKGAAIGLHVLSHDEVYYVLSGEGEVESDGTKRRLGPGMTAYLFEGANVGIRQTGAKPLSLIVAYPLKSRVPVK
ncbi:cupin domain-containing protein [Roseomonas aeriglobus]|nr:cupin domain-containing protein [Roseomonas aeriglobus]